MIGSRRFCPDLDKIKDDWIFTDDISRPVTYNIEIVKCQPMKGIECYDDEKIQTLLNYFNF